MSYVADMDYDYSSWMVTVDCVFKNFKGETTLKSISFIGLNNPQILSRLSKIEEAKPVSFTFHYFENVHINVPCHLWDKKRHSE